MFAPKTTSSAAQPRKRAPEARAWATISPLRLLVSKSPPRFAFDSRR